MLSMLGWTNAIQVLYVVVERISVFVVNMMPLRDLAVVLAPYISMQVVPLKRSNTLEIDAIGAIFRGRIS